MTKLETYRYLRACGDSPIHAAYEVIVPLRVRAAIHLLRGKPTMYGLTFSETVHVPAGNSHLLIASCSFHGQATE